MATYTCDNFKSVRTGEEHSYILIENGKDAARVFAQRLARKQYGKRGTVAAVRMDCYAENGSYANYEVFIGRSNDERGVTGHNEYLTVYVR